MLSKEQLEHDAHLYKLVMHINGVISILSTTLAVYVILKKSTTQMNTYKWHLLHIVFWSALLDFYSSFFFTPMFMFPANGMCSYGLFSVFNNLQFKLYEVIFLVCVIDCLALSISLAFLYRLAAITQSFGKVHNKWTISAVVFIYIVFTVPVCISTWYTYYYESQAVLEDIKTRYPIIYHFSKYHSCIYSSFQVTPIGSMLLGLFSILVISVSVFGNSTLIFIIIRKIKSKQTSVSNRTLALHKQLTYSLIVQFLLPVCLVCLPFFLVATLILFDQLDNIWTRASGGLLFLFSSSHSFFNCLSMIVMTGPYRRALFRKLIRPSEKPVNLVEVRNVTSVTNHRSWLNDRGRTSRQINVS